MKTTAFFYLIVYSLKGDKIVEACLNKHIIAISLINNGYASREYVCGIVYSYSIKNVFTRMIPHWYTNRDHLSWIFDSLEEAKENAVKSLNFINKSLHIMELK